MAWQSDNAGLVHDALVEFLGANEDIVDRSRRLYFFLVNALKIKNLYCTLIDEAGVEGHLAAYYIKIIYQGTWLYNSANVI